MTDVAPEVIWHPEARHELIEAARYYDDEAPGLGSLFLDGVERVVELVQRHPAAGHEIVAGHRKLLVARFPYGLIYRVDGEDARRLYVLAIAHAKRRPRYWSDRRP